MLCLYESQSNVREIETGLRVDMKDLKTGLRADMKVLEKKVDDGFTEVNRQLIALSTAVARIEGKLRVSCILDI